MDNIVNIDTINQYIYDVIIVPGAGGPRDGMNPINTLPEWVSVKLDYLINLYKKYQFDYPIILLSAGTIHKPGSLDINGRNSNESTGMLLYLESRGIKPELLYDETSSYDTIGNGYFLRTIHTDVMKWSRMLIIVNEFHYKRLSIIFNWIFSLPGYSNTKYQLYYLIIPDNLVTDNQTIIARKNRENQSTLTIIENIKKSNISNMTDLHQWMYSEHKLYSAKHKKELVLKKYDFEMNNICLKSY